MGFLKKMMASVGVGAARVDTRVHNPSVRIGEDLTGTVLVKGGSVEQRVERINLGLTTRYKGEESYVTHTLFKHPVIQGFDIRAGEVREFPFSLRIPEGTPLSLPGSEVWLVTDADIAGGVDPGDHDGVRILPSREMEVVIEAAQRLGFHLKASEIEYHHGRLVQELSFTPPYGQYRLSELEMMIFPAHGGLDVILEVDRRATGLSSLFTNEFETKGRWFVSVAALQAGVDAVAHEMQGRIHQLS